VILEGQIEQRALLNVSEGDGARNIGMADKRDSAWVQESVKEKVREDTTYLEGCFLVHEYTIVLSYEVDWSE
jgi:hypothetical protein